MKDESKKAAEIIKLKAERDAEFVRGLERALELMRHARFYTKGITAILAEIDKMKASR